ncbi:selenide, water dikinase SelD [Spirulina sp. 06S082]|uniref:selenide, water dikinase SelD n=1 Tax=Spirulina sp. 06S082 TaxID=3110248 RepID=UPI002B1F324F|nr:selenide, water dikinase SelD [Spirulina sp. 06S082]MEA5471181.1 selenide, water dikinase SelD [Spirulina sp. 06S082]
MIDDYPIVTDLVLIGGGHSHAIALKLFAMNPIAGLRITLISDALHTPYSGMLPGHIAGFYTYDESHIDLQRLSRFANVQLYHDRAIGLDLKNNKVICQKHPPIAFDYLSIDIGSTPVKNAVVGAAEYAIPVKPVPRFLKQWETIVGEIQASPHKTHTLAIVGGGAGGVELMLNVQAKLENIFRRSQYPLNNLKFLLFHRGRRLMTGHNTWVSKRLTQILKNRNVELHLSETVSEIQRDRIICESGLMREYDYIFWTTQASAPAWIQESGLVTDSRGFILVEDTLQSISHSHIFATGDIATMKNHPRPKAGVFAVRQGKPLSENLRNIILDRPLKSFIPQKQYLALIGTGDKSAIASRSFWGLQSPLLWHWKDWIDREFMNRFDRLPPMSSSQNREIQDKISIPSDLPTMYCGGCGSKVGETTLKRVLNRLEIPQNSDIIIGLNTPDDAAILRSPDHQYLVQTIDHFRSLVSDPFIFGQIATHHSLNDLFAMGATPKSALAMVNIPFGTAKKVEETLYQLLSGAIFVLNAAQVSLVGGHTIEDRELAFGLACNGCIHPEQILRKKGMKPGQSLILTKAIGTGTLFAADRCYQGKGRWIEKAIASMLLSNQIAAQILQNCEASACTDVTGFGLLGHLQEMLQGTEIAVELNIEAIPILEGAIATIQEGFFSSLHLQNVRASTTVENGEQVKLSPLYALLFDPQTSGGLLAAIPADRLESCLQQLQAAGYSESVCIGRVTEKEDNKKAIVLS